MKGIIQNKRTLRIIISCVFLIVSVNTLRAQEEKQLVIGQQPVYKVAKARQPITIDGKMDDAAWQNAQTVSFDYFYRADKPVDKQKSKFRMLWDSANIYLFL